MIRVLLFLAALALPFAPPPVAAQTTDPTALTESFRDRRDAGEAPGALAAELAPQIANPPAADDWFAPLILHAELLAEAEQWQAAYDALIRAEGYFYTVPEADPMFLDWILILQGLRLADLGHYGDAADRLEPLLPSVAALFGEGDRAALLQAIPIWRAIMLHAEPERAFAQLNAAVAAYESGNPGQAEPLALGLLLPRETLGDEPLPFLITAMAQSLLSLIAADRGAEAMADQFARNAVALLSEPEWHGSGPLILRALPPEPEFTDMAVTVLFAAASRALDQNDHPRAKALMAAMTPLATTPQRKVYVLNLQTIMAGNAQDLDAMIDLNRARLALLQANPQADPLDLETNAFEYRLLSAFRDLKAGQSVDLAALQAQAGAVGSALHVTLFTDLLVTLGKTYLAPDQVLVLAQQAIDQRDKTTAALTQSETARDAYLRAGRDLTETWLNAAFNLTRADIAAFPPAQLVCSDETEAAFCVVWSAE